MFKFVNIANRPERKILWWNYSDLQDTDFCSHFTKLHGNVQFSYQFWMNLTFIKFIQTLLNSQYCIDTIFSKLECNLTALPEI